MVPTNFQHVTGSKRDQEGAFICNQLYYKAQIARTCVLRQGITPGEQCTLVMDILGSLPHYGTSW